GFSGNYGGAFEVNGILCVENVTFKNNRANNGGAAIDIGDAGTGCINVTNCLFDNNYAGRDGGALSSYGYGEVNVVNSTFINCSAGRNGGAIAIKSGDNYYKIVGCTFIDDYCTNLGNSYGGAIYAWSSNFIVEDSIFVNCRGQWGGAIGADGNTWTLSSNITGCLFMDNVNAVKGGAIYIDCFNTVNINYNVFVNSSASYGSADHTVIGSGTKTKTHINLDNNWFGCNATEFDTSVLASRFAAPSKWLVVSFTPAGSVAVDESVEVLIDILHNQNGEKIDASLIPSFIPGVLVSANNGTLNVGEIDLIDGENIVVFTALHAPEGTVITDIGGKINEGTVVVTKGVTEISIDVSPVAGGDGNDINITATLPENVKGSIQLTLVSPTFGNITTIELPVNSYAFTDLPGGDYVIEAILLSDDYYPTVASAEFTVPKFDVDASVNVEPTVKFNETVNVVINGLPSNLDTSKILITDNGKVIDVELVDGTASYVPDTTGNHSLVVSFAGDDYYNPFDITANFTVLKLDVDASVNVEPTAKFNETVNVVINGLPSTFDTSKIVITDNDKIIDVELVGGTASYVPTTTGNHSLVVSFAGDDYYNPFDITANFTVTSEGIIAIDPGDNATKALNDAIASANAGDIIFLGDNNVYDNLSGIELKDGVTILGGKNTVVKAADGASSVFTVNSNASNVTIKNVKFVADKNGTSLLAIATKDLGGGISEVPEVSISGVTVELANGVDAETISLLNVNSTTSTFKPSNDVSISKNTIVTGVKTLKTNGTSSESNVELTKVIATSLSGASSQNVYAIAYGAVKSGKYYSVTLKDANGNVLANKNIKFNFNGKTVTAKTNANGVASLAIDVAKAGTYALTASFDDASYGSSSVKASVKILKNKVKITKKTKKVKKSSKKRTLKYYVKTTTGKKVGIKGVKVYLKINKKTYKAKTNKKGLVKFKVKLPKVKKTYKVKVTFKGDKANNKKTLKTKLKVY
ncbi:Ig-like domain-containing protein, partial [Methanobrevibacter sp.]|uniref:Ig-like domain-containing protein n=1 Tax=Methanobrevibacter sp. TaxID=66852 RepID=UPI00386BA8CB